VQRNTDTGKKIINSDATDFDTYLCGIIHEWSKTVASLVFILVPLFFILDYFTMPKELLPRFGIYRLACTIIAIIQYTIICRSSPSKFSYLHGYLVSVIAGGMIVLMTVDLGGFDSSYYAGLNLVIIGVNLLLPWMMLHSALNSLIVIGMYLLLNFIAGQDYDANILTNNLFFLFSTAVMAVIITHVRHKLVKQEFHLLIELKKARDALWSEMELAKRIQTALLPNKEKIRGFEISAKMLPAKEVGGDYYDIMESPRGDKWVTIGDVSGHGVDSGLIMMMAQTSIISMINNCTDCRPSAVLNSVNRVIRENISRMGSDHYMTLMAICIDESEVTLAGKHQDVIVYRSALNRTEVIPTQGTWMGISDDIERHLEDETIKINEGDVLLLFTDGITEATNKNGEMYGQLRLEQALNNYADLPVGKLLDKVMGDVKTFQEEQFDDMTLLVIKKWPER
jgi:serine phosphatase RsbU (regulator of sigma subunit)